MDGGYETAVLLATKAIVVLKREMIICVKYTNGQLCKKKKSMYEFMNIIKQVRSFQMYLIFTTISLAMF